MFNPTHKSSVKVVGKVRYLGRQKELLAKLKSEGAAEDQIKPIRNKIDMVIWRICLDG